MNNQQIKRKVFDFVIDRGNFNTNQATTTIKANNVEPTKKSVSPEVVSENKQEPVASQPILLNAKTADEIPDSYIDDAYEELLRNQINENYDNFTEIDESLFYGYPNNNDNYFDENSNKETYNQFSNQESYENPNDSEEEDSDENYSDLSEGTSSNDEFDNCQNPSNEDSLNNQQESTQGPMTSESDDSIEEQKRLKEQKIQSIYNHSYGKYVFPNMSLLESGGIPSNNHKDRAEHQKAIINNILRDNGLACHVESYIFGPTVIVYRIKFENFKEKPNRLATLEETLQMYLQVESIRILIPIPGEAYCGLEVPYEKGPSGRVNGINVYLKDVMLSKEFKENKFQVPFAVGKTNFGNNIVIGIETLPHALVAGGTQSGKTYCIISLILSIIFSRTPDEVRFIIADPKHIDFGRFQDIPHLAMPVIFDEEYFAPTVEWLAEEMDRRKLLIYKHGCSTIKDLNVELNSQGRQRLPYIIFIMDEFNAWYPNATSETRASFCRLIEQARAVGIHVILATQHPTTDVVDGKIKGNLDARFAFKVTSNSDSTVILDNSGASKLVGNGDMILRANGQPDFRLQGSFSSDSATEAVLRDLRKNNKVDYLLTFEELKQSTTSRQLAQNDNDAHAIRYDELFKKAAYHIVRNQSASANYFVQTEKVSWNRVNSIFQELEFLGIIGPSVKGTSRKVLVNEQELEIILENNC